MGDEQYCKWKQIHIPKQKIEMYQKKWRFSRITIRTSHLTHDLTSLPCSLNYELQQFQLFYERTNLTEHLETKGRWSKEPTEPRGGLLVASGGVISRERQNIKGWEEGKDSGSKNKVVPQWHSHLFHLFPCRQMDFKDWTTLWDVWGRSRCLTGL